MATTLKSAWEGYAAPLVGLICVLTIVVVVTARVFFPSDDECDFCPVYIQRLEVQPHVVTIGQPATLLDGVCNESDWSLNAHVYLGAQSEGSSSFSTRTVDLLTREENGVRVPVRDTPEGRRSIVLQPGCTATEPIVAPVSPLLSPGTWRLRVHIVVNGPDGEVQHVTETSPPFEVRAE